MPVDENIEIGLLIGNDCPMAIRPLKIIAGKDHEPYGIKTNLGWGIVGKIVSKQHDYSDEISSYSVMADEYVYTENRKTVIALKSSVKEVINPSNMRAMLEQDFNERCMDQQPISYNDKRFLQIMENEIVQRTDGHYELPLPLKANGNLPNNKAMALKRLNGLKRKFVKNKKYFQDYCSFMDNNIDKGYAEEVPSSELHTNDNVWYLPHHGVYHPRKPGKLRVVFDCSAKYNNICLNECLLQGPDLTNRLASVLCRFRQENIAFTCDIEGMFHQVKVNEAYKNLLRFIWWPNGNLDQSPIEYRMTVHLFGATSSPSCCNFVLKRCAEIHRAEFGDEVSNFIQNNFYVDDGLMSVSSVDEALSIIQGSREVCKRGGFHLHKFLSNSPKIMMKMSPKGNPSSMKNIELNQKENSQIERTLGIQWCIESDTFQFRLELKDCPITRRGILATISSVFDPLGFIAPVILIGKKILQILCRDGANWDDPVSTEIKSQ